MKVMSSPFTFVCMHILLSGEQRESPKLGIRVGVGIVVALEIVTEGVADTKF